MSFGSTFGDTRESERESRLILESIPGLVAAFTPRGEVEFVNRQILEYFGATLEDLKRWQTGNTTHPDDLPLVIERFTHSIATGDPFEFEVRVRRHDGVYRWFQSRGFPLRDADGHIVRWYNLLIDIDERKRAETQLAGEIRLLEMVASGCSLTEVLNALCSLVEEIASDCYCDVELIDRSGPKSQNAAESSLPGFDNGATSRWSTPIYSLAGHVLGTFAIYQRIPGTPAPVQQDLIAQVTHIASIAIERAQSEAALKRSEAFLAEGQRLSLTGSFSWRVATEEITWSDQVYRIFEFDRSVLLTLDLIATRVHPEDVSLFHEMIDRARAEGSDFEYEQRLQMPDNTVKYLHVVAHGARDPQGRLEYIGAVQDVTERRLSEEALARVRSELTRVARGTTLGTLTASIAHEVNQPLSGIVTNASTCLRMLAADSPDIDGARETARRTIRDGNRAADVIARLRALYKRKEFTLELLDLNEATREVIALSLSELQRNRVVVHSELADDLPNVVGDRIQIQQVVLNLVRNASDAMVDVHDWPRQLLIRTEREGDDRVRLAVQDAGIGIDPQNTDKLFDSFYTTKSDGMGIGLSISRSIIERHQGRLWAERNDGPGATFSFSIPRDVQRVTETLHAMENA